MDRVSRRGILNRKLQEKIVEAKLDELAVRPRGVSRAVRQLSGGNQQKVVLAKWLLLERSSVTNAMPLAMASAGRVIAIGAPATRICPDVAGVAPNRALATSVLPLPTRPNMPTISPA